MQPDTSASIRPGGSSRPRLSGAPKSGVCGRNDISNQSRLSGAPNTGAEGRGVSSDLRSGPGPPNTSGDACADNSISGSGSSTTNAGGAEATDNLFDRLGQREKDLLGEQPQPEAQSPPGSPTHSKEVEPMRQNEPIFDVSTLVQHVRRADESPSATPKPTEFRFELLTEAAAHNWSVLKNHDRSLSRALEAQGGSPLQPGSEFRDLSLLEPILGRHPLWPRFRSILDSGSDWALDPVSDESRLDSVTKNIGRGNHKSARDRPEVLKDQVLDDVTRGFALPLPAKVAPLIPGAEVAPMGLVAQNTISEAGEIMPKDRLTHDQSFEIGTARSVNNRARMEDHQPVAFGHALRRVIHYIADARHKHPRAPILLQKVDFKAACRRAHLAPSTAVKTITTLDGIALMSLRLTFGGRPCPSEWCNASESAADLARALLQCSDWDPSELHGPQQKHLGRPKVEGDDVPFAPALDMIATLPDNKDGIVEPHIDDLIAAAPDLGDNKDRMSAATLLAIHALGRPASDSEPLPRDDATS